MPGGPGTFTAGGVCGAGAKGRKKGAVRVKGLGFMRFRALDRLQTGSLTGPTGGVPQF